ncbi:hypothetical protein CBF34_04030 [Vagococcus penaei]|uniref:Uncharacterized protein n=1 Tax=Vagococcus penaei TaxID=633807 RepID=A0A1Q2D8R9_9ENTE|nr:TatD family hydrolase [Vagococcus penaei]AQP54705.1 hypothetical protein BW732_11125 [Vagococcus penaei]RSU05359.1 hypothetical protein CBF34_04030 [Vagococcus penaei]
METNDLIDAHCHYSKPLVDILIANQIPAQLNCQTNLEWTKNSVFSQDYPFLSLSAGIHPWDSQTHSFEEFLPILEQATVIGEIGMDSVWTTNDLLDQENLFIQQLAFASSHKKPVILHTKGQEKNCLRLIQQYPNTYLVHWYGTFEYLDDYIRLGCYFTAPLDARFNEISKLIIEKIPVDKLLMESDGLQALAWVLNKKISQVDYLLEMRNHLAYIAKLKHLSINDLSQQLVTNFNHWLNLSKINNSSV